MLKAVIFDLDGVLVHTDSYHYLAWKQLAEKLGLPFDEKINNRLRGISRMDSLEIVLENSPVAYTQAQKEALAAEKNETYKQHLKSMTRDDVTNEVRKTLRELKARGLKIAVGSGSKNAPAILRQVELMDIFDAVVDGTELTLGKPNPEVFLKAAQKLNENPQHCMVVEDADSGISAALQGGMIAVAIGEATHSGRANYNIESFSDLLKIVDSL